MSKFVHVDFSASHAGVERIENAVSFFKAGPFRRLRLDSSRTMAAMLVAALVAALLVVANQVIETITDGHLFAAWIGMWAVGFAAMALIMNPALAVVRKLRSAFAQWRHSRRLAREDAALWALAARDHRVMADIRAAASVAN